MQDHPPRLVALVDALSLSAVVGTLAAALPPTAALLSVVWTLIRIYETRTVQQLLGRPVPRRRKEE